ncbi:MAG: Rpn family recombination-promoting nuclease/putative transposase [Methylococcaceae bacterium]|nr:MAG: Rpn family recombination-promoting nuclease/putative transposase [Methylococcaceae bacterium]
MKHHIDPKIDCVFKALLGSEANRNLLVHFLNAVLKQDLSAPITEVDILNPYNDKEFLADKLSVVDVKAKDGQGQLFQVEVQLLMYRNLPARIIYTWADIYSQQLQSGEDYHKLQPTYAIWLVAEDIVKDDEQYAREYKLRDENGRTLIEHGGIWLLELSKFRADMVETERQRWLKFFKDGDKLDDNRLPEWMNTEEMRQAMGTLKLFSEKERHYHEYQARQNYLREQRTIQWELEQERQEKLAAWRDRQKILQEKEAALQREEAALQREEAALREIERLKSLLNQP